MRGGCSGGRQKGRIGNGGIFEYGSVDPDGEIGQRYRIAVQGSGIRR